VNRLATLCTAGLVAGGVLLSGQVQPGPRREFGASVTGAFEGWYYNPDGTRAFLVGYYNRNSQQDLDVPIGPDNRIEPGGPDLGQPTHFLPGRQWGMFTVPVPKDFKPSDFYTWTIVANGQSTSIPLRLRPDYIMSPFTEIAVGNTPPVLRFEATGRATQGPLASVASAPSLTVSASVPLPLAFWASDDMKNTNAASAPMSSARPPVTLRLSKYRGLGAVTFDKARPEFEKLPGGSPFNGKATATVKFGAPGDYMVHVTVNDYSGDGGAGTGCCWTTSLVKVTVTP
jgi:hypothetical protein